MVKYYPNNGFILTIFSPKWTKATAEYVKLVGYKNGEMGRGREKESLGETPKKSWNDIAKELGISRAKLSRVIAIERSSLEGNS